MQKTVVNTGNRNSQPPIMRTSKSEGTNPNTPRVIEDEMSQCDVERLDSEDEVTSDVQIERSVKELIQMEMQKRLIASLIERQRVGKLPFLGNDRASTKNRDKGKLSKVGSINVKSIETNEVFLRELLKECDILAVQEHKLFTFQLSNIEKHMLPIRHLAKPWMRIIHFRQIRNQGDMGV